jgi:16S rRNA processing protein RimM
MSAERPSGAASGPRHTASADAPAPVAAQAPAAGAERFGPADVRLGYVNGLHGVSGEVKIYLYNPGSFLLQGPQEVTLVDAAGGRSERRVEARPGTGKRILARIQGIDSPEAAVTSQGWELVVSRERLPKTGRGTWYVRDLVGLPVYTDAGRPIGALVDVHDTTGLDVWVIRDGSAERWVLALKEHIVSVTLGDRIVVTEGSVQDV